MKDAFAISELQNRIALYQDMKAYRELYDHFFHRLFRFSYSFVKSAEVAEEIVSDVFIKIWELSGTLNAINNLSVYLYTITKNFSLNYITKSHKFNVISLDDVSHDHHFNMLTPEESLISAEGMDTINRAIRQLPPQCRVIFYLVKECDLKYKDVAAVLNVSVNTVRNQVAIAVRKIADSLPELHKKQFLSFPKFSQS